MTNSKRPDLTIMAFLNQYEHYLVDVRGLARNSCGLHMRVVCTLLEACFTSGNVIWNALRFEQIAAFLTKEFRRLPNHWTQRAWLMAVRGLIRYLETEGCIPNGWREALPKRINWKQASLPRSLSLSSPGKLCLSSSAKSDESTFTHSILQNLTHTTHSVW